MPTQPIPFFTDQNVPDSVGNYLLSAGHEVTRLRAVMPIDTKDPVIAVACSQSGKVLVTNDPDFRGVAKRLQITQRDYQNKLHRILLRCPPPVAAARMKEAMSLIESEWLLIRPDRPLVIEIRDASIRTER